MAGQGAPAAATPVVRDEDVTEDEGTDERAGAEADRIIEDFYQCPTQYPRGDDSMSEESFDACSRTSPMSLLENYHVQEKDEDIKPVLEICGADETMSQAVIDMSREVLSVVAELGGNVRGYRRERARVMRHMVAEAYSVPRVTKLLKQMPSMRLIPGFALDLTTHDADGKAWDFTSAEMRDRARQKVRDEKPLFLIGSPPCTEYCSYQSMNSVKHGWSEHEIRRRRASADVHLEFVSELYRIQIAEGRFFLHEHPAYAGS